MYKNQLQELAQRSCFNLPSYACIREGPDHAPRFKATVNFNGETFESPSYFPTLRQAEHAAAEIALNTLAERVPSKSLVAEVLDETGVYKNLLQETAHRAGLNLPSYTTLRSGPGHTPVFSCTVDIAGMTFTGESAKTKKQAQKNAAMTAWSALKQMSQCSSSSSATSSVSHEEQEQVVVARFLASLNPAGSSNSSQNNRQKGPDRQSAPAPGRIFLRSTPTSFGTRRLDWQSYNIPPEVLSVMWYQEQLAQRQRPVMALPVPIPPVPPSTQVLPWMPSMLQPSHYPYCVTGEQPVPLTPGINMRTANSPYYFSNQVRPDPMTAGSMVTIQDRQEEILKDPSFHSPAVPPSAPPLPRTSSDPRLNERLKKEAEQQSIPQTAPLKARDKIPTVFDSARPANIRLSHATTSNYHGNPRTDFPTALRGVPAGPTQMQSGVGSFPARPRFGRMQEVGFPSAFTAPAVQIRSVVPVCSAAPSRKMPSTAQTGKSTDDSSNQSTDDVSIVGSSLGNLQL